MSDEKKIISLEGLAAFKDNMEGEIDKKIGEAGLGVTYSLSKNDKEEIVLTGSNGDKFEVETGTYSKPDDGIPKTDLASTIQTSLDKADSALQSYTETDPTVQDWAKIGSGISVAVSVPENAKFTDTTYSVATTSKNGLMSSTDKSKLDEAYTKPSTGIPKTDLASAVQTSLGKADTALQSHQDISGKVDKSGGTITGTLILSKTTDASGTEDKSPALVVGGTRTTAHIEMDANEIMAKSDGTTPSALNLNLDGGNVYVGKDGGSDHLYVNNTRVPVGINKGSSTKPTYVNTDGIITACSEDFGDYAKKSSSNTFSANQVINRTNGTTTAEGSSMLTLGNNVAKGTDKNSYGLVRLYGHQSFYTNISPATTLTSNTSVYLPSVSGGTLLADNTSYTTSSKITISSGNYNNSTFTFRKIGNIKMVFIVLNVAKGTTVNWVELLTIPSGFENSFEQYSNMPVEYSTTLQFAKIRLLDGKLSVRMLSQASAGALSENSQFVYF